MAAILPAAVNGVAAVREGLETDTVFATAEEATEEGLTAEVIFDTTSGLETNEGEGRAWWSDRSVRAHDGLWSF